MAVFCSRCGKPLPEGAAFCASCGSVISAGATAAAGTPAGSTGAAAVLVPASAGAPALYAGFWRRLGAFLIDGIIIGIVMTPFGLGLWGTIAGIAQVSHDSPEALAAIVAASMFVWLMRILVTWLYGALFESSPWQGTPGKKALGLRVTDLEGRRISFARATGRSIGKWLSGAILCVGYIMVAFTTKKQGLHDLLAGTVVRR